jgi:hypothetical protein
MESRARPGTKCGIGVHYSAVPARARKSCMIAAAPVPERRIAAPPGSLNAG